MSTAVLVRYGAIPEVSRFRPPVDVSLEWGQNVVVQSHRGLELGVLLNAGRTRSSPAENLSLGEKVPDEELPEVLRAATRDDLQLHGTLRHEAQAAFDQWQTRIREWNLELELIDLEWTLDRQKLVLYVLGGRGPDSTRLALQAAAAGLSVIEVQPVSAEGAVPLPAAGGGCGSGGCGCHH
jgi:cell fate regulator YaaT (PSP1 superfamily)